MVTVPPHVKIVFRGIFASSPEIWSFSTKWKSDVAGAPDLGVGDIHDDQVEDALTGLFNNSTFSGGVKCTEWRAYKIGADGTMQGNPRQVLFASGSEPQGSSGLRMPTQLSLTVSTVSANRGPARYGRFYLPGPSVAIGSDWRLSASDATAYNAAAVTFVKAISDACDIPNDQRSVPMINVSGISGGSFQEVDHLRVGRVYDTQRKRRNALVEDYQESGHIDW